LDFLAVFKKGRIFTGRLIFTLLTHLLGKRRYGRKIADRICLNFFITDESLEIELKDIYSSSEYSFIFPVFDLGVFEKFQKENLWIRGFRPNFEPIGIKVPADGFFSGKIRRGLEFLFDFNFLEEKLKKWQLKRISTDPRTRQKGSAVIAGDDCLIFLPKPHGPEIYEKYKKRLEEEQNFFKESLKKDA
jgi:hypothetical protein